MENNLNYYEILEIYPAAAQEEIDNAFRMALYKCHPDHNPDRPEWAHERTAAAVEAYNILSNPMKRKIYNFLIFAKIRKAPEEEKFNIFQGGKKKKYAEAVKCFKEGVELFDVDRPTSLLKFQQAYGTYKMSAAVYNMGVVYTHINKLSEALRAFKEAARLDKGNTHFEKTVERIQELMKEIDRARK